MYCVPVVKAHPHNNPKSYWGREGRGGEGRGGEGRGGEGRGGEGRGGEGRGGEGRRGEGRRGEERRGGGGGVFMLIYFEIRVSNTFLMVIWAGQPFFLLPCTSTRELF